MHSQIKFISDLLISDQLDVQKWSSLRWFPIKSQSWLEIILIGHQMCMENGTLSC